jgi:hypothetical protein
MVLTASGASFGAGQRGAVGRHVDVPGVHRAGPREGGGALEVVGQRDRLPLGVVDRQRGGVVVGVGVLKSMFGGTVAGSVIGLRRIEVELHDRSRSCLRRDAARGQLQRHRQAGLDLPGAGVGLVAEQLVAGVVDDEAFAVDLELAVARILGRALPVADLEEAAAVDGQVQRVVGGGDAALGELLRHGRQRRADAGRAGAVQRRSVEVGELGARGLGDP